MTPETTNVPADHDPSTDPDALAAAGREFAAAATAEAQPAGAHAASARDWFASVPQDWSSWKRFRESVCVNRHTREAFLNWLASHVDEVREPLKAGLGRFAGGQIAHSLPLLQQDKGALARLLAGHACAQTGKREAALAAWRTVDGGELGAQARCATIDLLCYGRDLPALEAAAAAVRKAGDGAAHVAFAEGALAEARGEHAAALEHWRRAVETDASHAEATFRLAELLNLYGDDEAACALYERFRDGRLPPHVGALVNLGVMHMDAENHAWAMTCFRLVAAADPTNARVQRYLAYAEASAEQYYDESRERSADKQSAVLRIPVTDFELSVRARNCLQRMSIHTLGDLVARTESELLSFKNFGETSLQEVKDILMMKGLRLGMMPSGEPSRSFPSMALGSTPGDGDVMEILISELDLSVRSRAALAMLGITKVGELTQTTETTLLSCKNFGQTSLDEIKSKLRNLGLELAH